MVSASEYSETYCKAYVQEQEQTAYKDVLKMFLHIMSHVERIGSGHKEEDLKLP